MKMSNKTIIEVQVAVDMPSDKVWDIFTQPKHIVRWNYAADSWHSPRATNELNVGGKFNYRMEAIDGSQGFDFEGIYSEVKPYELIEYTIADGRKVKITFTAKGKQTIVKEAFEAENVFPPEQQKEGWQAILNNFKKYAESTLI